MPAPIIFHPSTRPQPPDAITDHDPYVEASSAVTKRILREFVARQGKVGRQRRTPKPEAAKSDVSSKPAPDTGNDLYAAAWGDNTRNDQDLTGADESLYELAFGNGGVVDGLSDSENDLYDAAFKQESEER